MFIYVSLYKIYKNLDFIYVYLHYTYVHAHIHIYVYMYIFLIPKHCLSRKKIPSG